MKLKKIEQILKRNKTIILYHDPDDIQFLSEYWQRLRYLQFVLERPMKGYYKGQPRGVFELEDRFFKEANNDTVSK